MADRLEKTPFTVDSITNHATIYLITNRQGKVNPIYQLDARFDNLQGNLRRYEASTKLSDKKLALKEAKSMVKKEYKHRMSYGERRLNISNDENYSPSGPLLTMQKVTKKLKSIRRPVRA